MISKTKSIETCVDKLSFYKFGKNHDLPIINTTINIDKIESQYFVVKERFGAGSKKIGLKLTKKEAIEWAKKIESPIYQPFIIGKEASIDVYINKHNKPVGIVPRWREMVVDGESKITSSFNNEKLVRIINKFIRQISLQGHIIIQVLIDDNNEIQIIECNPRFGGASTLSLVAGLDSFYWFFIESIGQNISVTSPTQNLKGLTQIRYKNDIIISK